MGIRNRFMITTGVLGLLTSTIGAVGGSIGAIDIVEAGFDQLIRDITIAAGNDQHARQIVEAVKVLPAPVGPTMKMTPRGWKRRLSNSA